MICDGRGFQKPNNFNSTKVQTTVEKISQTHEVRLKPGKPLSGLKH